MGLLVVNVLASLSDYTLIKDVAYDRHPLNALDIYHHNNRLNYRNQPLIDPTELSRDLAGPCREEHTLE